jgi:hypothetical protein
MRKILTLIKIFAIFYILDRWVFMRERPFLIFRNETGRLKFATTRAAKRKPKKKGFWSWLKPKKKRKRITKA